MLTVVFNCICLCTKFNKLKFLYIRKYPIQYSKLTSFPLPWYTAFITKVFSKGFPDLFGIGCGIITMGRWSEVYKTTTCIFFPKTRNLFACQGVTFISQTFWAIYVLRRPTSETITQCESSQH